MDQAKTLATKKFIEIISDIFINDSVIKAIEDCGKIFNISPRFFIDSQIDNGSNSLEDLIQTSLKQWSNNFTNGKVLDLERYIMDNFNLDFCEPKKIDRRIFKRIATAFLFGIPKKRVFDCIPGILRASFLNSSNCFVMFALSRWGVLVGDA